MADFGGKMANFQKCHGFDSHHTKTMRGNIRPYMRPYKYLTIHETPHSAWSRANDEISQNAIALIVNEPN